MHYTASVLCERIHPRRVFGTSRTLGAKHKARHKPGGASVKREMQRNARWQMPFINTVHACIVSEHAWTQIWTRRRGTLPDAVRANVPSWSSTHLTADFFRLRPMWRVWHRPFYYSSCTRRVDIANSVEPFEYPSALNIMHAGFV